MAEMRFLSKIENQGIPKYKRDLNRQDAKEEKVNKRFVSYNPKGKIMNHNGNAVNMGKIEQVAAFLRAELAGGRWEDVMPNTVSLRIFNRNGSAADMDELTDQMNSSNELRWTQIKNADIVTTEYRLHGL